MPKQFEKVSFDEWMKSKPVDVDTSQWDELYDVLIKPERKTRKSSGYDFHTPFGFTLEPGEDILLPMGVKIDMYDGEELVLAPRSGLGFKFYTRLANTVGKIDADYYNNVDNEGHIMVKIRNEGTKTLNVKRGDAIVQGTFYKFEICDGDSFENGKDRQGGFGSTSK